MEKPNKSNALLEVMRETAKDVPAVRWAIGVVGLAAGVALISSFKLTLMAGLLGFALMIPSMVLLYLFSRNLLDTPQDLRGPKLGLVWFSVVLLILSCAA